MDLVEAVGILSSVLGIFFMLSAVPTCMQIKRQKSTDNVSSTPFLAGIACSGLWLNYGLLTGNPVIYVVTTIGTFLNIIYIAVFYIYTQHKRSILNASLQISIGTLAFMGYTVLIAEHAFGEWLAGLFACISALAFCAAPLAGLGTVIKTKSTAIIPLPMVVGNTILSLLNLWYGILLQDTFMTIPNAVGSVISLFTVSLFFIYPNKPSSKSE